ncbi:MAG: hypothetical protein M0P38_07645, partial [Bacteroidales bacterium]|nr:hypothetical protein [Bacteroidales bacterium]
MKKFFIILFVLIGTHSLQSQTTLPIYYDFDDADNLTQGWNLVVQSPDSWNTAFAAIQNTYSASQPNAWAFASFFPDETGYNQYLISPRFNNATADSINVIFKYLTDNTSQIESFRIGYYTGNPYSSPTDFIWKDSLSTSVSTWTDYSINLPPNAQNICINYYSENQSALYIDDIVIRPESNDNQYFITVMNNDGGTVIPGTASVNAGDSIQFTVTPNEGYHIASVTLDGVQICATTSLPFTYTLHNITDNHIISANFQINEFSVSIHSTDGGSITPNGGILGFLIVPWDTTVTFTFTANEGYHIRDVILDDTIHLGAIFTYTIEHIRTFHSIYANFSPNRYTITASATTGGSITPDGINDVDFGEELSFIITANDGYILDSLLIDGIPYPAVNPDTTLYTFLQISDNHTIDAYFSLKKYIVHFTHTTGGHWQMEGGTLIGQDSVQVTHGSSLICHALSDEGFHVTDIILNANHLGAIDSYNLMNISENMDIHAIFDTLTYSFQAFAFGNGTITPLMIGATNYFDSVTISLSANYCKQIDSVFLDGNRIGANDSYQFSHLAGAHTLTAYFGTIHYTIETDTDGNGQIEGENTVNCGNSHTYVFNSNPCYRLKDVFIDGNNSNHLIEIFNRREQITLENITENHTIYATFEHIPYMIEVISGENGTIDHVGINNVNCGDTMNFTITPDICHQIESVYLDGILINQELRFAANEDTHYGDSAFFRLSDIHQNHLIEVSFVPQEYDFTAIQGTNGTIFPDGNSLIQCGDAALYTIVPDECYVIDSVWIDRELSNSQLEFSDYDAFIIIEDIHASHDIRATFERREHQITIEVGANGNFHTDDETTLSCGDDYQFTLVPEWCYRIDSVFLNGSCINHLLDYQRNTNRNIGDSATYTLMNVSQDYDLRVTFAPILYTIIIDERDGGSITHTLDSDTALCGENVIFTIAPDTCFAISNIILNGEYFYDYEMNNGIATINFSEILTNIHLVAHFAPISYTITSNYSGNGIVFIPSNPVLCGDTTEIRFLARNCSHLDSVTIDGNLIHLDSLQQVGDTLVYTIQNISQNHFVNAFFSIDSFPVHISNNLNFPISINDTILACGNSLHFYIIQNECFKVDSIIVNEQRLDKSEFETIGTIIQNGDTTYYSINQLQEPTDIFVILDTNFYEINISCSPHGHVSYEGTHRVMCGSNLEIAVMPDSCYHWNSDYLLTLGYSIDNDSTLLLVDIHHDITLFFAFEPTIYQVTSIAGSNGSIFRDSDVDVACDGHVIFTIKPDECFEIDSVFLDNNSIINSLDTINDIISYELRHILANHEFRVTFKPKQFVVQVVGNDIGYISNIGNNDVTCGDNLDFKLVPGDCSNLDSIILDGEIYTSPLQYWGDTISFSLINIQEDHQVFIYFKRNTRHIHEQVVLDQMFFSEQSATVFCHEDTTITFSSNDCWITDSIFINHERITPSTSYHFSDIMTDIEIVIFAHTIIYEISIEQTTHGRIIQEPISDATCGDSITLLFEPERGYYIDSIIIDGDTLPASSSYSFNNISDNHSVSAIFSPYTFQITVIESDGGQITPGTSTVLYNDNLLFNITPDTCYRIDSLFVDGFYKGQADHYLFTEITDDHTISATFTLLRDTLSLTASANGQVFPSGDTILNCGDSLIYTIVPDECYQIGNLFIDGVWHNERIINDGERYTLPFNNIDTQHTISISFDPINYMFEANTNGGGTVSPMFSMPQCGNNFDFSIEPASCYQIDSVWINDSLIPLEGFTFDDYTAHYSLHNIRQDYQVYVKFKDLPHRLSFENQNNGTVSIPDTSIICNNDITFYIIPDLCYAIDNIELNNISINHLLDIHENTQSYLPDTAFYTIQNFSAETVISISYTDAPKRIITQQYYADNQLISEINALIACGSDTTLLLHEECYNIDSVWLNGIFYGNNEELILNNIIDNQTIIVNLSDIEYSITTLPTINGTIEPPGMNQVVCNHDFTCTILPDSNFFPVSLIVDNDTIPGSSTYTFFDVRTDHTLGAIFKSYTYTVTSNSGVGGSIIPETAFVDFGDNVTMQIIPDSCHIIDSVWIDDIYQGNISQIYLPNIDENHHVRATFVPYEYFITAENTMNGFITPSGVNQVLCGDDATFTITPNDGYHIENLIIDGDTISADSSYVFTNITNNHSINAVFAINSYEINTLAGNGGIITPATAFLDYGDDVTLQIIPDDCYFIDSVWV